jgi:MFS transporter, OFA family, oxalate/formate antiporter
MSEQDLDTTPVVNHGVRVVCAAVGINLALGILYTWSVFKKNIPAEWGWKDLTLWPYAVACLVFCLIMVPAGRMQDKIGPRIVATIGGVLVGVGLIVASQTTSLFGYILGFGVLAGAGMGFGYASATPPAVKWFPAAKTGMIAGIVVSGFGLASVYIGPLAAVMLKNLGMQTTVLIFGIAFMIVVCGLAQLLKPPPKGYVPAGTPAPQPGAAAGKKENFTPGEMVKTWQFYLLWFMYACGSGAGLMIIGILAPMAKEQAGIELGFILVAALAVGNGGGRILAGIASDKIGRKTTMCICFLMQAVLIFLLSRVTVGSALATTPVLVIVSALVGANYGANLSLFPSATKDFYGLKNFGINYGLVFTSWGVGGFVLAVAASFVRQATNSFNFAYYCSAALLVVAAIASFALKAPHHTEEAPAEVAD